jgi:hypothetical protein
MSVFRWTEKQFNSKGCLKRMYVPNVIRPISLSVCKTDNNFGHLQPG